MFEFIEKLHQKSEHTRRKIGLFIAGGITFIIFLLWLVTFNTTTVGNTGSPDSIEENIITPFETIARGFNRTIGTVKSQFESSPFDPF